ncbi:hypothetical protein GJAV_G00074680 [Gymnothorax javanicus]|nr:hypothetical protein GJAV_G00074680 [Gymnothorax javanicus]
MKLWKWAALAVMLCGTALSFFLTRIMVPSRAPQLHLASSSTWPSASPSSSDPVFSLTDRHHRMARAAEGMNSLLSEQGFYDIAGFPRVLGAIDCTHIPISTHLGENEADFVNRKSFHNLNVQMTCDHQMMVTSLVAKWPGSVHDSRICRESLLRQKLKQGQFSGVLLGDRGYACLPYLMIPYPDPGAGPQMRFNVAHAKTRVRTEMTFGVIKARFASLHGLRVAPDRACRIISACVVLHDIATIRKERTPPQQPPTP